MTSDQPSNVVSRPPSGVARWVGAVICFVYGFAKLNGSQFTVLDSELTRPLGEVSGFWLTWYYFGYSPAYGNVLALVQVACGVLLVIPRTALLGALLLLPVVVNIVLIDIFYRIDPGATMMALLLLLCAVVIAARHVPRLLSVAVLRDLPVRPTVRASVALLLTIVATFAFTWWVANVNNRAPTAIDGIWTVSTPDGRAEVPPWQLVFFEYNRAHLVVFRGGSGDRQHHFEVAADGVVRVWDKWLAKGALVMEGQVRSDNEIELVTHDTAGTRLILQRVKRTP